MRLYKSNFAIDVEIVKGSEFTASNEVEVYYYPSASMVNDGSPYYLPTLTADSEDCAVFNLVQWAAQEGFQPTRPLCFKGLS